MRGELNSMHLKMGSSASAQSASSASPLCSIQRREKGNVCDRDVGYNRKWDGPRTTPAPHKICCIHPKKPSIATKFESRDHYIM